MEKDKGLLPEVEKVLPPKPNLEEGGTSPLKRDKDSFWKDGNSSHRTSSFKTTSKTR